MSIAALTLSLYHSKATYSTRLVLIAIANFEGENGAYPSIETIGRLSGGLNRRTVQRCIDELVQLGELTEVRRDGITNLYKVTITCPDECDGSTYHKKKRGGGLQTTPAQIEQKGGGVQTTGGAVSRPPEPLDKPKRNLREQPLPDDWQPDDGLMEMFVSKWPDLEPSYHIEQFRLYYLSKGTKHKNWSLTFQRWMNQEQARAASQPWRAGSGENAKRRKSRELEASERYLQELKKLEEQASPPPKCPHGNNIALCQKCIN